MQYLKEKLVELAELSQSPYSMLVTRMNVPDVQAQVDRQGLTQCRSSDSEYFVGLHQQLDDLRHADNLAHRDLVAIWQPGILLCDPNRVKEQ